VPEQSTRFVQPTPHRSGGDPERLGRLDARKPAEVDHHEDLAMRVGEPSHRRVDYRCLLACDEIVFGRRARRQWGARECLERRS
jgi:hypothetical protein